MTDLVTLRNRIHAVDFGLSTKLLAAIGFAGLTAGLAQIALPVPWTPVPLTLQLLAVFLAGTMLGPRFGALSMLIYVVAGAVGFHVFAPSSDAYNAATFWSADRWRILVPDTLQHTGYTAGYLLGYPLAAAFIGWALRRDLTGRVSIAVAWALAALLAAVAAAALFVARGSTLAGSTAGTAYDGTFDYLWVFGAAFLLIAPAAAWLLLRHRGGPPALRLFVVVLASVAFIHTPGAIVLKFVLGWSWTQAFALGSAVFLPFDALKAGLAVAACTAFLPQPMETPQ